MSSGNKTPILQQVLFQLDLDGQVRHILRCNGEVREFNGTLSVYMPNGEIWEVGVPIRIKRPDVVKEPVLGAAPAIDDLSSLAEVEA